MRIKQGWFVIIGALIGHTMVSAGDMGPLALNNGLKPIISLQGGYAASNAGGSTQSYIGADLNTFTYSPSGSSQNTGFIGGFIGVEYNLSRLPYPGFFMQTGVEYNYFGNVNVNGINTVGVESQTATIYNYHYGMQTQQVLGALKLFATVYNRFYPYGEVALGAAFNNSTKYSATTTETGSINLTPGFSNQNNSQFSYNLGLGVEGQINPKIRVGLGYRYSNFGSSSLTNGVVTFNNYQSPVPFNLSSSNTYANLLIARASYLI